MTSLRSLLASLLVMMMLCSLSAPAFGQARRRPRAAPVATGITFDNANPKLTPKKTVSVKATVIDQYGQKMPEAKVIWEPAEQPEGSPLSFNGSLTSPNTLVITAGEGSDTVAEHITTRVTAVSGEITSDLTVDYESKPKPVPAKITFTPASVDLAPDGDATITAALADADDNPLHGNKVTWALANPDLKEFVALGTVVNDKTTNSITLIGRTSKKKTKAPDVITLVGTSGNAVGLVTINYKAPSQAQIETVWNILPPRIAGDSYGRTIKNDYYCIVVSIKNETGGDLALAGLNFSNPSLRPDSNIMTTPYGIAHNSMARRRLTHPRAMTLAIVDGLGTLMTGFNPFFHDINHAKNYSQFIDILSNPLKSGIEKGWKDPYPDELANFERDVLKDDKVIANHASFTTTIFVPKRLLFDNKQKTDRENLKKVRETLGHLLVMGYKFDKGISLTLSDTP